MSKQIKEAKKEGSTKLVLENVTITKDVLEKLCGSLPLLKELRLLSCKLTSVPLELCTLFHLEHLQLDDNQIGKLTYEIG